MTQDEQKQFDQLQAQLSDADQHLKEIRVSLSSALGKSNNEARLYRTLFWGLFLLMMVVTIVHFFE
jgi:type VI protein secretion system component VasF